MASKRRAPPPPQESDTNVDESPPRVVSHDAAPLNGEHGSVGDVDAVQMRPVSRPESESDESSESETEVPEPVQKKVAAMTSKSKAAVPGDKRPAREPSPSGRSKRAKAEARKATSTGKKGKKANAEQEKGAALEATRAAKGKETNAELVEAAALEPASAGKGKKANAEREKAAIPAAKGKKKAKKPVDKEAMAAAAASQYHPTATKSEKGQAKKEKLDGNSKGGTVSEVPNQKESNEGHAGEVETGKDVKRKLSKEETTAVSPRKSKRLANGKQASGTDAKSGTSKETAATDTENGDDITKRKQDEMDIDLMPKEVSTDTQNHGAQTEEGTHQEKAEIGANVPGHRSFDELLGLYPCLAGCLERIEAEHPCGETLKRAFGYIGNEKANALESRIKGQEISEMKVQIRRQGLHNEVLKCFL